MLVPAITMRAEIEAAFDAISYTTKSMYYEGCIYNFGHKIEQEENSYMYAIIAPDKTLIGYVSYRVDWYSSQAYNFGLMNFTEDPKYRWIIANGIKEVIKQIQSYNLHRIEFRAVGTNPAIRGYRKIVNSFAEYTCNEITLTDYTKDRSGNYCNMIMFELLKR